MPKRIQAERKRDEFLTEEKKKCEMKKWNKCRRKDWKEIKDQNGLSRWRKGRKSIKNCKMNKNFKARNKMKKKFNRCWNSVKMEASEEQ